MPHDLHKSVWQMPKIELHRHLEGALRLESLVEIARDNHIPMPEYEVETLRPFVQVMNGQPRTPQNFLSKFSTLRQFYLSPEIICRLAREAIIDAAEDNIKYLELRFTPSTLCSLIKCDIHDAIRWVNETASETSQEYNIIVKLIVSINRHEGVELAQQVAKAAIDLQDYGGIVGLDLAGAEVGYSASQFRHIFRQARQAGLHITLHAGEWEGAQSVWDAVGNVGAERIGHGIRVVEDPGIVTILKQRQIVLEVCPSSNVDSGAVTSFEAHPLRRLIDSNLKVTINTDDPLVSGITLTEEMVRTVKHFDLTLDDLKHHTIVAAQSAFLPEPERTALVAQFEHWLYPQ